MISVEGTTLYTITAEGTECYKVYCEGTLVYAKGTIYFNGNGGSVSGNSSLTTWWGQGQSGSWPSAYAEYHDFLGWYTDPSGGSYIDSSNIDNLGWWDWSEIPSITLYAHWRRQEVTVSFSYNRIAYGGINQNYPGSYTVYKGISYADALSSVANSYLVSYSQYNNRFYHPDWGEWFDWNAYIPFYRRGWSTEQTGDRRSDKTNSGELITEDTTFYPSFSDYAINVWESGWADLDYFTADYWSCSGNGGGGRIFVNYNDVTRTD